MERIGNLTVFFLILLPMVISGCGSSTTSYTRQGIQLNSSPRINLNNTYLVRKTLSQQLRQWQGTPYRYGGLGRDGVDCSGFVYLTFRSRFGIVLPRSTDQQIRVGLNVTDRKLKPGDLVFFSTGLFNHHVGIYLGGRSFIHVSKSRGVSLSSLNNRYWHSNFKEARRIR
jgi:cell wall-associated NlpC family hydrolase